MAIGPGLIRLAMTENYKYTSKNNPLILNKNKIIMKSKSCREILWEIQYRK